MHAQNNCNFRVSNKADFSVKYQIMLKYTEKRKITISKLPLHVEH